MKKGKYIIDDYLRGLLDQLSAMDNAQSMVFQRKLLKKDRPISDLILFLKEKGLIKAELWSAIYRKYPELINKTLKISLNEIIIL